MIQPWLWLPANISHALSGVGVKAAAFLTSESQTSLNADWNSFNWKGIQAEQLANQAKGIITPVAGGTAEDPYNWKGIQAEQLAQGQLVTKPSVGRKPTPVKPPTATKPVVVQPPRPGSVVRF